MPTNDAPLEIKGNKGFADLLLLIVSWIGRMLNGIAEIVDFTDD